MSHLNKYKETSQNSVYWCLSSRVPITLYMSTDSIDTTTANTADDFATTKIPTDYTVIVPSLTGIVKWFNNKSGFGFITVCENGDYKDKDIFVHYSSIRVANHQYKYLVQGEYVDFTLVKADSKTQHEYQAMNVSGVKGGPIMCEIRRTTLPDPSAHTLPRRENDGVDAGDRPPRVGRMRAPRRSPPISGGGGKQLLAATPGQEAVDSAEAESLMGFTKVEKKRSYASAAKRARK